jgi:pimeloyl-[acyl-carrier protein] synthase
MRDLAMTDDPSLSLSQLLYPEVLANPYPFYHRLRGEDPVHWDHLLHTWVVTGYDDVLAVLQHFSAARTPTPDQLRQMGLSSLVPLGEVLVRQMLFLDAATHSRIRSLCSAAFSPRRVEALRSHIQEIVDSLLDAAEAGGGMDVIADLADPLPAIVTAEMLGLPTSDWQQLTSWATDFAEALGNFQHNPDRASRVLNSLQDMCGYFHAAVHSHRQHTHDDLICALLRAEQDGESLSEEEVVANSIMLLTGGQETTTNLIGNGLLTLLRHPDQWDRLRADPALIPSAIEELLRYESPIQLSSRLAPADMVMGGREIAKRQAVIAVMGAANRDPARFADPDSLDICREDNRHLAFGWGPHFCFGAPLARLEGQIAFETLLRRMPGLSLAQGPVSWRENLGFRGLTTLPVELSSVNAPRLETKLPPHDAAPDAGNTTPSAAQLSEAKRALIAQMLGADVPQTPTSAHVSDARLRTDPEERQRVVEVQRGGSKRPFFFLHGQFKDGPFFCYPLARSLGLDQPFYALEPYSFEGLRTPPTFEEIAAAHLRSLRAVQPEGPYLLGGWCNGGLLAYEMARQLRAQDQRVELVVLMDPVDLVYPRRLRALHGTVSRAGKLLRLGKDSQLDWLLRLRHLAASPRHVYRYLRYPAYRRDRASWRFGRGDYPGVYDWIAMGYRPADLYPGKIVFLWSVTQPFRRGWSAVEAANDVEVHVLPCEHITCLNEYLDDLGELLRLRLAAIA